LSSILPENEEKLNALVFVTIKALIPDIDSLTSDLKRLIGRTGKLTAHPDGAEGHEYMISLRNGFRLRSLLDEIKNVLGKYELPADNRIMAVTNSPRRTLEVN